MNILVSACLLGVACRYDGKSKEVAKIVELLKSHTLIPVCPEQLGGLATPRTSSERKYDKVINKDGVDVTFEYEKGAEEALKIAKLYKCSLAILKEKSPSCGCGQIYDGSFTKKLISGNGTTTDLLLKNNIKVISENSDEVKNL